MQQHLPQILQQHFPHTHTQPLLHKWSERSRACASFGSKQVVCARSLRVFARALARGPRAERTRGPFPPPRRRAWIPKARGIILCFINTYHNSIILLYGAWTALAASSLITSSSARSSFTADSALPTGSSASGACFVWMA